MTQPIPSETIEYEPHVDGLRAANTKMVNALQIAESTLASFYRIQFAQGISKMADGPDNWVLKIIRDALAASKEGDEQSSAPPKTITIHVEGGLVQDVTGIPAGYEVRVEDHDEGDTSHPSWDAEKGCFITIYSGEVA